MKTKDDETTDLFNDHLAARQAQKAAGAPKGGARTPLEQHAAGLLATPDIKPGKRARKGGHATSAAAAARAVNVARPSFARVLSIARIAGPDGFTHLDVGKDWRRLSELERLRWIVDTKTTRDGARILVHREYLPHTPPPLDELPPPPPSRADLMEQVKELKDALAPFAKCAEQVEPGESDGEWAKFRLLIGDYRRAAKAMAK